MDWDPEPIGESSIRLAYRVARKLGAQTIAMDILHRGSKSVVIELTVNYASRVVEQCRGHWLLNGDPMSGPLQWIDGPVRAEGAVFEDFLAEP